MIALTDSPTGVQRAQRTEPELIESLQRIVSASRLGTFLSCRLKFYFRYVLEVEKPKSPALHVGSIIHEVLKLWNKARWKDQMLSLKQLYTVYGQLWSAEGHEPVEWEPGEEEQQQALGWRLLETYFRESNIPADVKPDAVEVPVEADLSEHGLPTLVGVIDLVQEGRVIDFKTTSKTPDPEKVAHTTEIQTSSYAILYREATGSREKGIELHHLVKLKNPKLIITALEPMTDQQQTRLFRAIESYVHGLDQRDWVPSPGMQCSFCEYFNECRRWC